MEGITVIAAVMGTMLLVSLLSVTLSPPTSPFEGIGLFLMLMALTTLLLIRSRRRKKAAQEALPHTVLPVPETADVNRPDYGQPNK